jgi:hypothetical protein
MSKEPDLQFDIDALFDHMVNNLEHDVNDELDWHFLFRSSDLDALNRLAEDLESEFFIHIQEQIDELDEEGDPTDGQPELIAMCRGAFTADQIKEMASQMQVIAEKRELTYAGVNCYEPLDEQELLGWLEPDDAAARLQHMTAAGLAEDADLPWSFLVSAVSLESSDSIAADLDAEGFNDRDDFSEPDDEGNYGTCVFMAGRNNEAELLETARQISSIAAAHGGELYGIQFYTRDDVAEIFGSEIDPDDED